MKILIFAHSGMPGGAEHALRRLVNLLTVEHTVEIVLPSADQGEAAYYQSLGLFCHLLPAPIALPNVSSALLTLSTFDLDGIASALEARGFDFAISNTIATLHGAIISARLRIPHVYYAHEHLDSPELTPTAISKQAYLDIVQSGADGILSCSSFVAGQFRSRKLSMETLPPYDYSLGPIDRPYDPSAERAIQVIGTQSFRKNPQFAATLAKSLRLRGLDVRLDIIGSGNDASAKLGRILQKRHVNFRIFDHLPDPYSVNRDARVVTLVCAGCEPYGLTIPESLRRRIPVIATRSGGPQEMLPDDLLYDHNDLDRCARLAEEAFLEYDKHVARAADLYRSLALRWNPPQLPASLTRALERARSAFQPRADGPLQRVFSDVKTLLAPGITLDEITQNISTVASSQGPCQPKESVAALIQCERERPGTAVVADVRSFNVVPFSYSPEMDRLYEKGLGLAVELASTFDDAARTHMAAFIVCALAELRARLARAPKVLAVGDGLGIDSLRLANCGLDVDYMDYSRSRMASIAALNFESAARKNAKHGIPRVIRDVTLKYDAVVCLEVIEHVAAPEAFSSSIAEYLRDDGLLFISDCFNGVEDRWPTHLLANEPLAGMLPALLSEHFDFLSCNKSPFGKPFLFRKASRGNSRSTSWQKLLTNRDLVHHFISSQLDIGL